MFHFVEVSNSATLYSQKFEIHICFFSTQATGPESAFGFTHPEDAQNSRIKNVKFSQNIKPNVLFQ